jgi:hypothetical protein
VHFLRFELSDAAAGALKSGADLAVGVDHAAYRAELPAIPPAVRNSLARDLS